MFTFIYIVLWLFHFSSPNVQSILFVNKLSLSNSITHRINNTVLQIGSYGTGNIALSPKKDIFLHGTKGSVVLSPDLKTTYRLPNLRNATIVSDLTNRTMYALMNEQLEYMSNEPSILQYLFPVNLNSSTTAQTVSDWMVLSEAIWMGYNSAVFSGLDSIIVVDGDTKTVFEIDLRYEVGKVTVIGECMIKWNAANGWLAFGIIETASGVTSLLYFNSDGKFERQYLGESGRTEVVMNELQYSRMSFSIDIASSRWYYYYLNADMTSSTLGYADMSLILSSPTSQPSSQPSSQPITHPTLMPTLSLDAPKIKVTNVNVSSNSVKITITLDSNCLHPGKVFCALFDFQDISGQSILYFLFNNLIPLSKYALYCYTETALGMTNSLDDMLNTKTEFHTICCKQITFLNAPSYVYADISKYSSGDKDAYTYRYLLSAPPNHTLTITPKVISTNTSDDISQNITISPNVITFSSKLIELKGEFVLFLSSPYISGKVRMSLEISGASKEEYYHPVTDISVEILSSFQPPPAPKLQAALFGDNGIDVYISFDSVTDFGGQLYGTNWKCNKIFFFQGNNYTDCSWVNATTVRAIFDSRIDSKQLLNIGNPITLLSKRIKAFCVAGSDCNKYSYAMQQMIASTPPKSPIKPSVLLRIPSAIGGCDELTIDASNVAGNCGRNWTAVDMQIVEAAGKRDTTILTNLLNSKYSQKNTLNQIFRIPRSMLFPGKYIISISVTNYFGQSTSGISTVQISGNNYMPRLKLLTNSNQLALTVNQVLEVRSQAFFSSCSNETENLKLVYVWSLLNNNTISAVRSISRDQSIYLLPRNVLIAGENYLLMLNVSVFTIDGILKAFSITSTDINVLDGNVVARIDGGSVRQIALNNTVTLDATTSYDENTGSNKNLKFSWSCSITTMTLYGSSCDYLWNEKSFGTISVFGEKLNSMHTYQISLIVIGAKNRQAATSILIEPVPVGSPFAEIVATSVVFNVGSNLTLSAYVQSSKSVMVTWESYINGHNISISAYSPLNQFLTTNMVQSKLLYAAVINTITFVPGSMVTFRVIANQIVDNNNRRRLDESQALTAYSQVYLTANGPPKFGTLNIDPLSGFALSTSFTFLSSGWIDDISSYPLTYSFSYYLSPAAPKLTLSDKSAANVIASSLPAGLQGFKYLVFIQNVVYDCYSAFTTINSSAKVEINTNVNVSNYLTAGLYSALNSGNPTLALQTVNNVASTINVVNCSSTSPAYCEDLFRTPCAIVPQTCGRCKSGYKGIVGVSNTKCFPGNTTSGGIGSPCNFHSDCVYNFCDESEHCAFPHQQCKSSVPGLQCSGHGKCAYTDPAGLYLTNNCTIDQVSCKSKCICDNEYGGDDCSLDPLMKVSRDSGRSLLCISLQLIKEASNPSSELLYSLVVSLLSSYSPVEVFRAASIEKCEISLSLIATLSAGGFLKGHTKVDDGSSTAELIVEIMSNFVKPASESNSNGSYIADIASLVTVGIFQTIHNGEFPAAMTASNLRLTTSKTLVTNLVNLTIASPMTAEEQQYGIIPSSYELIGDSARHCNIGNGYAHLSVMQWAVNPFPNASSIVSPILRISNKASQSSGVRRSLESVNTSFNVLDIVNEGAEIVDTSNPAYYVTLQFFMEQRFKLHMTTEEIKSSGKNYTFPDCTIFNGAAYVSCGSCNVSTYTNYNITFVCHDMRQICPSASSSTSKSVFSYDYESFDWLDKNEYQQFLELQLTPWEQFIRVMHEHSTSQDGVRRWLQSSGNSTTNDDDGAGSSDDTVQVGSSVSFQQYAALFVAMSGAVSSVLSTNPFAISLEEAKTVLGLVGSLFTTLVCGAVFFFYWDESDRNQLIYSNQWPPKRTMTVKKLLRKFKHKVLTKEDLQFSKISIDEQINGEPFKQSNSPPPSPSSRSWTLFPRKKGAICDEDTILQNSNAQSPKTIIRTKSSYEKLIHKMVNQRHDFRRKLKAQKNMLFTDSISDFFDLVTPDIFLHTNIFTFLYLLLTQHDYTTIFFRPSTAQSRYIRWIHLCKSVLLALFIDTLFFQVFFSNTGACEAFTTKTLCTTEMNSVTGDTKCTWTGSGDHDGKGTCELNPPPSSIIFTMILALTCVLIALPIDFAISFIVDEYCTKRPMMEAIGWSTDYWLGRGTTSIEVPVLNNEAREKVISNLQVNFQLVEDYIIQYSSRNKYQKYKALMNSMNNNNVMVWHEYTAIEEEVEEMLKQVLLHYERFSTINVNLTDLQLSAWKEAFNARTESIVDRIGVNPDGQFRSLTFLERFKYSSVYDKVVGELEEVRDKMAEINEELELMASVNKQLQEVILLHNFVLEHFTPFKVWILQTQLNCFEGFMRPSIHPYTYFAAWFFVYGAMLFFLYWMFAWSAANGSKLIGVWGINYSIGAIQDMFFVQIGKLIIMYLICIYSIKPQLQSIRYHLHGLAISTMQGHVPLRKYVMNRFGGLSNTDVKSTFNDDHSSKRMTSLRIEGD